MLDKQAYKAYLVEKRQTPQLIEERMKLLDEFQACLKLVSIEEISAFTNQRGLTSKQHAYKFLADYSAYITKKAPQLRHISSAINKYCYQTFSNLATQAVLLRKQAIVPIPTNTTINPKHLGKLTNKQFIHAFAALQNCLINIYDDAAQRPFQWGYPDFYIPDPHRTYNRIIEVLFAFVLCGLHEDGVITVDANNFSTQMKLHKKIELLITELVKMGFEINGFDKKAISFQVTYPENPHVLSVLYVYIHATHDIQPQIRINPRISLSYRFLEDASTQKYEPEFLAAMDCASPKLYEIQMWLYEEAAKCGYHIDPNDPMEACGDAFGALRWGVGCIVYKKSPTKNAKRFLIVGDYEKDGKKSVFARVVFHNTLHFDHEAVKKLRSRFPYAFSFHYCGCIHPCNYSHRTSFDAEGTLYENCSSSGTWFEDINLKDTRDILALFKFDRKIK